MQENTEKIDAIKLSIGKDGKEFYYQKWYSENSWRRIPKLNYDYCLKYNLAIATEIKKDANDKIVFMSYRHEKSEISRERQRKIDEECFKKEGTKSNENKKEIIKKTLGKDGKYYFYKSLDSVEKSEDVYWYKTDEKDFEYTTKRYNTDAINIKHNEKGEIIYMEYKNIREKPILSKQSSK